MVSVEDSINQRLLRSLQQNTQRPALFENGDVYHYGWLKNAVASAAMRMQQLGVEKGDRVAYQLRNTREAVIILLATLMRGAIPVPILPSYREKELRHILHLTAPKVFALQRGNRRYNPLATLQYLFDEGLNIDVVLVEDYEHTDHDSRYLNLQNFCAPLTPAPELHAVALSADDTAIMLLSSGTTGLPKAIARKNGGYSYMIECGCDVFVLNNHSVYFAAMPVSHGFVINCPGILGTLSRGGAVALADMPSAETALEVIERCGVTHTTLVPALLTQWSELQQRSPYNMTSLWHVQVGGARVTQELAASSSSILGITLQQCYGMSEGLLCFNAISDEDELRFTSQGRPLSPHDEVLIVDEYGHTLPVGQSGELITRGPYTLTEYYQNPQANRTAFTHDGFYRTGDLAHVDQAGNVFIDGRVNDAINRGGEKFCPNEIEELAEQHPAVIRAACVGMDDALYGEVPCLFVTVAHPDHSLTLGALRRFFEQAGLAAFKAPEKLLIVESIPMKGIGKIDRLTLREMLRQTHLASSEKTAGLNS
ncbi:MULTISPECIES: AMP-binding protein [Serratia]|uniref:AMP-binding protein n=1 Tax=Serratia TaxID=613 RepID=UPI000EFB3844|nr:MULTISPECIES: AMP-binding protein [Serratia]AYO38122.1 siderophore biosynthesis protein [Serratia sp. P2ACOL2]MBB1584459.1 AMP-binding protein [Serratia sp. OS31]WBL72941.1 AMP-binding protein [Serratia liquefaciens]HBK4766852.1 AMP-binding protein [Serratia liquefaciens]